jgi:hypothetical protein
VSASEHAAPGPVTFAVIGHDEAATLRTALEQAFAAAEPGDRVWFVDSASTDDSAALARSTGATVFDAPKGKGRAVVAALSACDSGALCLVDADIVRSEHNIARRLRDAISTSGADMVIGEYQEPDRRRMVTPSVFRPLTGALFPEVAALDLAAPLSGFRALRAGIDVGDAPAGYGIETHLDIELCTGGRRVGRCPLGVYEGPLRGYSNVPAIAADVAAAVLDLAERHGRLTRVARVEWDRWLEPVLDLLADPPPPGADDDSFVRALEAAAQRPLPTA